MSNEYRIKEIRVPLKSGEIFIFYPQVKITSEYIAGYWWWKKLIKEESWSNLYLYDGDNIISSRQILSDKKTIISCMSKEEAERIISKYETQEKERTLEYYKKNAIDRFTDDRFVVIHPEIEISK